MLQEAADTDAPFQIALLDIDMPGPDVERLLRRLAADPAHAQTPVIWMAPTSRIGSAEPASRSDRVQTVIVRPVRAGQLIEAVRTAFRRRRVTRLAAKVAPTQQPEVTMAQERDSKILVAEDNEVNRTVISLILQSAGLEYEIVCDGQQAVDHYRARHPALVLMDVSMPDMNGLDATRAIRTYEAEAGLTPATIVGVTAHALTGDEEMCLEAGMDDFLSKPINRRQLLETISTNLGTDPKPRVNKRSA